MRGNELINPIWVFFIVSTFLISSCAGSKSFVSFEILEPAAITYPEEVNQVGYLNRAPYSKDIYNDIIQNFDPVTVFIVDSMVCNNLRRGFLEGIQSEGIAYLDTMRFFQLRRKDTTDYLQPITARKLNELLDRYKVDALISLEYYEIDLARYASRFSYIDAQFVEEFGYEMKLLYRVYSKGENPIVDTYQIHDTLYFVNRSDQPSSTYVNGTDVIRLGSYEFGYIYGSRQIPRWRQVARILFRGGSEEMRQAAFLIDKGDWEPAAKLWKEIAKSEDNKLAAKALHNLAIYYETGDEIQLAMEYAELAAEKWGNETIEDYEQELEIRKENTDEILLQVR